MKQTRIGLVSCTSKKLERPARARDLYSASPNFPKWVAWVEDSCDRWFVLSAKHHLVHPDEVLPPYDQTLDGASVAEKRRWSTQVINELEAVIGDIGSHSFEIHAGRNYWAFGLREELEARGATVTVPAEGLNMFERAAFYSAGSRSQKNDIVNNDVAKRTAGEGRRRVSAYDLLRTYLAARHDRRVELPFDALEGILGRKLPASARNHRAWWSNSTQGHSHARGWLDAGWEVDEVNLTAARVVFRKVR